ncbi:MAG: hypothetical protein ACFCU5_19735 [Pleurocapsa sp.]
MAKRRNAKKEKAVRNKINARKFRKPSPRYSARGRKNYSNNQTEQQEDNQSKVDSVS